MSEPVTKYPVYICTKGRAGQSKLLSEINGYKTHDVTLIVEPQDLEAYTEAYSNIPIVSLTENDKGLPYVRDFTRRYALNQWRAGNKVGPWYWNVDDDVQLMVKNGTKVSKVPFHTLHKAEVLLTGAEHVIGQLGLEYSQFAWSQTKTHTEISYCDCVVANNLEVFQYLKFDESFILKGDRDITLQVLTSGYKTIKVFKYCFSSPRNGSNAGGLHEVYDASEEQSSKQLCEKWGADLCTMNYKKDGRPDVKINWGYFKKLYKDG